MKEYIMIGILSQKNGGLLGPWGLFGDIWCWRWSLLSTNFYLVPACGLSVNNLGSLTWGGCSLVHFSLLGSLGSQGQRIGEGRSHYGLGSRGRLCGVSSFGASEGRWDSGSQREGTEHWVVHCMQNNGCPGSLAATKTLSRTPGIEFGPYAKVPWQTM